MGDLRGYEWITKQEGASIATVAASKSLERDAHVWTEGCPLPYPEVGNHTPWDWVHLVVFGQSVACDLQTFSTCIALCGFGLTRKLGDKLTQMRSELDQLGPFLMPLLLVGGRVTDITVYISISDHIFLSYHRIKTPFCISNRLEQKQTLIVFLAFWLSGFSVSFPLHFRC
jgi:hypothetical protein